MPFRFGLTRPALVEYMIRPRAEADAKFAKPIHMKFRPPLSLEKSTTKTKQLASGHPSLSSLLCRPACLPLFRSVSQSVSQSQSQNVNQSNESRTVLSIMRTADGRKIGGGGGGHPPHHSPTIATLLRLTPAMGNMM